MTAFRIDQIFVGNVFDVLPRLPCRNFQTALFSPPYFNLRDYGVSGQLGLESNHDCLGWANGKECGKCYTCRLIRVGDDLWHVLRDDGTVWINIGDSYSTGRIGRQDANRVVYGRPLFKKVKDTRCRTTKGVARKNLLLMPARIAMAFQSHGWILRADVIWAKPNPIPESVKDRPTRSYEHILLFSKSDKYYYDWRSIAEPVKKAAGNAPADLARAMSYGRRLRPSKTEASREIGSDTPQARNVRDVWIIPTAPYNRGHIAVSPLEIAERCILAGSRIGDVVLDPFCGTGTTCAAALGLGRHYVGIELNPAYVQLAKERISGIQPPLPMITVDSVSFIRGKR